MGLPRGEGAGCCWWASGGLHSAQQYLITPLLRKGQWRNSRVPFGPRC